MTVAINPALLPPGAVGGADAADPARRAGTTGRPADSPSNADGAAPAGPSFASVLEQVGREQAPDAKPAAKNPTGTSPAGAGGANPAEPLRFSKHAIQRVQRRGIDVGPATLARLADGVGRAAGKGSRDSIVLVDGTAFVVAVPSRTVVTAVGSAQMRDHVFTNIDSAVIA